MEMVRKTYKEKLRPTPEQERALDVVLWRCRTLYNVALEQRMTAWERCHVSVKRYAQEAELKDIREAFPEYEAIHSHVLQDVLARLDKPIKPSLSGSSAARSPVSRASRDATAGTPSRTRSLATVPGSITATWSCPRLAVSTSTGLAPHRGHHQDGHHLQGGRRLVCAASPVPRCPCSRCRSPARRRVSISAWSRSPRWLMGRRWRIPGTIAEPSASCRRPSGVSPGARRAAIAGVRRCRFSPASTRRCVDSGRDFHHKAALLLLREYDTIYHEDLQTANMVKNHHLAKSISDAGWSAFLSILSNKAACAGRSVVAVPPAYTSQACSGCGAMVAKGLSVRWHECPDCGTSLHRDHNAAKNIQWLGQSLRGVPAGAGASNREPVGL